MSWPRTAMARREAVEGYLFLLPWLLGFLIFTLGPLLVSFWLGFTSYRGTGTPQWVGFDNFIRLFTDDFLFWQSLKVTLYYAIGYLPLGLAFGLGIALLMNQSVPGLTLFRTIYYLPAVTAGVAVAILWQFVFHREYGILNSILGIFGLAPVDWLFNSQWVMVAFILMGLWGVGGTMMVYLAGLQSIPTELYEAASIDGANRFRRFWAITIPMMTPTIFFNLVTGLIGTLQIFTTAYIMTQGGPNYATYFFSLNIYFTTFRSLRLGYASALAWMLFVLILVLTLIVFRTARHWVYYAGEKGERA